jgi:NADPH-dependent 2,4-dienoyl-CoA reductase/sulfur reductase-like enzyme
MLTEAARDAGVQIAVSPGDAELLGAPDIHGVRLGDGRALTADLVVAAVGDVPNTEWLASSELLAGPGPLRVDGCCRLRPDIVAAGDVAALPDGAGAHARTPYWSSAVDQGRLAAAALLHGDAAVPAATNPYFWTDQFGIELKICGRLPVHGAPLVIDGAVSERRAVLQWVAGGHPLAAATINHRMPVGRLKRLAVPLAPAA